MRNSHREKWSISRRREKEVRARNLITESSFAKYLQKIQKWGRYLKLKALKPNKIQKVSPLYGS